MKIISCRCYQNCHSSTTQIVLQDFLICFQWWVEEYVEVFIDENSWHNSTFLWRWKWNCFKNIVSIHFLCHLNYFLSYHFIHHLLETVTILFSRSLNNFQFLFLSSPISCWWHIIQSNESEIVFTGTQKVILYQNSKNLKQKVDM